jgi:hypothetical protein
MLLAAFFARAAATRRWRPLVVYAVAVPAVTGALVLAVAPPAEYLQQNFVDFATTGRLTEFDRLLQALSALPYGWMGLAGLAVVAAGGPGWRRRHLPTLALFATAWVTGVFSIWTGSSLVSAGGYLVGVVAVLLARLAAGLPEADPGRIVRRLPATAWLAAGAGLALFVLHWSADRSLAAWNWRRSNLVTNYAMRSPGFEGWRCFSRVGEGVDRAADAIRAIVPPGDTLLVLPDATLLYGLTGRDSYRGIPWAWDVNNSPAPGGRLYARTIRRLHEDKPDWILLRMQNDAPANATWPLLDALQLRPVLAREYRAAWSAGDFVLLRHAGTNAGGESP